METFLSWRERNPRQVHVPKYSSEMNQWEYKPYDEVDRTERKEEPMLQLPVKPLSTMPKIITDALGSSDQGFPQIPVETTRRILREMKDILEKPHSAFDVYPCSQDIRFWRLLVEAPDGTPYRNGIYVL